MKCKVTELVTDAEGALYKGEVVQVRDWTEVGSSDDAVVVYVIDDIGKHHSVGLTYIEPL